jgi:methyl-accepting chemotaxis protein
MRDSLQTSVLLILVILGVTLAATVVIGNRVTRPLADAVAASMTSPTGRGSDPAPQGAEPGRDWAAGRRLQPLRRADPVGGEPGGETSNHLFSAVEKLHHLSEHADRQMQGHGKRRIRW